MWTDKTGQPPSKADRETAIRVVMKAIVKDTLAIAQINPELALELPNILRILQCLKG